MNKIKLLSILGMIALLFAGCFNSEENAEKILKKHLKERYGEEFVIFPMREREAPGRRWYESGIVYPESYIGTVKEEDSYYWGKGFVESGSMKAGDTYGGVLLNESANKFYGKKLEELFGKNYLAVLNVEGGYISTDFEEEMKDRKKLYEEEPEGKFLPLSGGIYIFGRVEDDKDREWYRKQIYEFIQFMKETGTFEYVRLSFYIIDERMLAEGAEKCFENIKYKSKTRKGITEEIDKILNPMTKKYEVLTKEEKERKLESFNKKNIDKEIRGILLLVPIGSIKYIENNYFTYEEILKIFGRKKLYDKLEDIQFKYEEFAIKEVKN